MADMVLKFVRGGIILCPKWYSVMSLYNQKMFIAMSQYNYDKFLTNKKLQIAFYEAERGQQSKFVSVMAEYGLDNFEITEVASTDDKKFALDLRKKYISKFQTNDSEYGYNLQQGRKLLADDVE